MKALFRKLNESFRAFCSTENSNISRRYVLFVKCLMITDESNLFTIPNTTNEITVIKKLLIFLILKHIRANRKINAFDIK